MVGPMEEITFFRSFDTFLKDHSQRDYYVAHLDADKIPLIPLVKALDAKTLQKLQECQADVNRVCMKYGVDPLSDKCRNFKMNMYKVTSLEMARLKYEMSLKRYEISQVLVSVYYNFKFISLLHKDLKLNCRLPRVEQLLKEKLDDLQLNNKWLAKTELPKLMARQQQLKRLHDDFADFHKDVTISHIRSKNVGGLIRNTPKLLKLKLKRW